MPRHDFRPLLDTPELSRLRQLVAQQQRLENLWQSVLPAELKGRSSVVGLEGGCLQLSTRSAVLVAKFKQMEVRLLAQLNEVGLQVSAIRWRVQVEQLPHQHKKSASNLTLSHAALEAFDAATRTLQPSPLRDALAEIVARRRQR